MTRSIIGVISILPKFGTTFLILFSNGSTMLYKKFMIILTKLFDWLIIANEIKIFNKT